MHSNLVQVNWEARKKVLFSNLSTLRIKGIHTDVTLSCDGESFAAHRLILTMGSGYFAKAFENIGGTPPSLILICGIRASILECLLSFIYDGTTTIKSEELGDLSKAGIMLEIPGLMELGKEYTSLSESMKISSISEDSGTLRKPATRSKRSKITFAPESTDDDVLKMEPNEEQRSTLDKEGGVRNYNPGVTDPLFDSDSCDAFEGWEQKELKKTRVLSKDNIKIKKSMRGLKRSHKCPICSKSFFKQKSLREHVNNHSSPAPYVCKTCGRGFRAERSYKVHILTHKNNEDVDGIAANSHLKDIPRSVLRSDPIEIKEDTSSNNAPIISNKENFETPRRETKNKLDVMPEQQMKRRKNNAPSERTIDDVLKSVSQSFKSFSTSEEYLMQDDSMYDRGITDIEASSAHGGVEESDSISKLKETLNLNHTVTSVNTRVCRYCNAEFLNSKSFRKHRTASCKILECSFCLANFVTRDEYDSHIPSHCGIDRPFVCPECTYSTDAKRSFEDHMSLHTGIFRFWCLLCDFQAKRLHELKEHTKTNHPEVNMKALETLLSK